MNKTNWKDEKGNDVEFIKVSELIDRILNDMNIPTEIRILGERYFWDKNNKWYKEENNNILMFTLSEKDLNATIEIIHEEKNNLEDEELDMRKMGNIVGAELNKFMQGFFESLDEDAIKLFKEE